MQCNQLVIKTDGTTANTQVLIDGKQMGELQRVELSADIEDRFLTVQLYKAAKNYEGAIKTRKVQVRDSKTQKFITVDQAVREVMPLEFVPAPEKKARKPRQPRKPKVDVQVD